MREKESERSRNRAREGQTDEGPNHFERKRERKRRRDRDRDRDRDRQREGDLCWFIRLQIIQKSCKQSRKVAHTRLQSTFGGGVWELVNRVGAKVHNSKSRTASAARLQMYKPPTE